jgi:hypothetical protein
VDLVREIVNAGRRRIDRVAASTGPALRDR